MIRGKRVTLEPCQQEALLHLRPWHRDGGEMQDWGERLPLSVEGRLEANPALGGRFTTVDNNGSFCICHETGCSSGRFHNEGSAPRDRRAQLGILIGEKDAWTKGYGEALVLLLNWLFNHRRVHRVWVTVQSNNPRAMHVDAKVGFAREGT